MKVGVVVRGDRGGLGAQTSEVYRHLQPERTLLIDLGAPGRGPTDHDRFPGALVHQGPGHLVPDDTMHEFCDGLDAIWSAETFYAERFCDIARQHGARTILHANPELWKHEFAEPDVVWAATPWELQRLPATTRVVPHPVATDRLPFRLRTSAETFVHVAAPAFQDRNGTRLTLSAARRVKRTCKLIVRGLDRAERRHGHVTIVGSSNTQADYWSAWPADGDVLVLPRRYAGLSLPMQEAAALGMPVVSLDLEPQRSWLPAECLVPALPRPRRVQMVGGIFPVHDASVSAVAEVWQRLVDEPALVEKASRLMGEWAAANSWEALLPVWRREMERACS